MSGSQVMQDLFDRVARHLLAQGERSVNSETCRYRGDGGRRCAIGALISDENYSPLIERRSVSDVAVQQAVCNSQGVAVEGDVLYLLRDLQYLHDRRYPGDWRTRLHEIASDYGLSADATDRVAVQ